MSQSTSSIVLDPAPHHHPPRARPDERAGIRMFLIIWAGQFISRIGTAMTRFALLIWAYEQTGAATTLALLGFFAFLPAILVNPFAGVWVDRLNRRKVMILADVGAGMMTIILLVLHLSSGLQLWHLYLMALLAGAFEAFQGPAYSAATTLLMPKSHYGRAAGLRFVAENGSYVIAPFLAGLLLLWIRLGGVMLVDLFTVVVALVTLRIVRIPDVRAEATQSSTLLPKAAQLSFWHEMQVGMRYLWSYPGLLGLTLIFMGVNFIAALTYFSTLPAMILARSGGDTVALASVQGALGAAGVVGALLISAWGGPRRKVHGILISGALSFICGDLLMAVGRTLPFWVAGAAIGAIFVPVIGGCNEAIWQAKVPPALQGRVFTAKNMLGQLLAPAGYLLGGLLADYWFEPALAMDGVWTGTFGWLVGIGPGAGIALMFVITSVLGALIAVVGYLFPSIRQVDDLPDYVPTARESPA